MFNINQHSKVSNSDFFFGVHSLGVDLKLILVLSKPKRSKNLTEQKTVLLKHLIESFMCKKSQLII